MQGVALWLVAGLIWTTPLLAAGGRSAAPIRFTPPEDARPLSDSSLGSQIRGGSGAAAKSSRRRLMSATMRGSGSVLFVDQSSPSRSELRWQLRDEAPLAAVQQASMATQPSRVIRTSGSGEAFGASSDRAGQAPLEPLDPFEDPFGDQQTSGSGFGGSAEPLALQAPDVQQPESPEPPRPQAAPAEPPDVLPTPQAEPGFGIQQPQGKPCDRIYNLRDCCKEEEKCKMARQRLRSSPITQISLDITPSFKPDALSQDDARERQRWELAKAPARHWRDRQGQRVASGQFTDFRNGRVIIKQEDGRQVEVPFIDLSDDDMCFVAAWWGMPTECTLGDEVFPQRNWVPSTFTWKASALCHKPLYFEEVQLERYGHSAGPFIQPLASGAHFFLNIAVLPYRMGINPPHECQYALGYYRPGSCAPWLVPPVPISVRGGLLQAAAWTGGIFLIP